MKKIFIPIVSAIIAALSFTGCQKTFMTEITGQGDQKSQGQEQTVVPDDEISTILRSIKGVSDVEIVLFSGQTKANDGKEVLKQYFFNYAQPLDHSKAGISTFKQRVAIQMVNPGNPVVVNTQGYEMEMDGTRYYQNDLCETLSANLVEIEYRYFGASQPESMNNVEFNYLSSEQAAEDIHAVVEMLKKNIFKNNTWVATGVSKGGITSALQAYYSDKKGWKDFDLYVPFCAPFFTGTPDSPTDRSIGRYIVYNCGAGYPAGSVEAKGYENLRKILIQSINKPVLREALLRRFHNDDASLYTYKEILHQYNPVTEGILLCGIIQSYLEATLLRFADCPFSSWANLIPNPDNIKDDAVEEDPALQAVVEFVFLDEKNFKLLVDLSSMMETKSTHTESDMIFQRKDPRYDLAYNVLSVRELGCVGMDYSWIPEDSFITEEMAKSVEDDACGRAFGMDYYEGQWDGGKLMTDFRKWVATENTQKIVFVYCSDDPWTSGAVDDASAEANPLIVKVMNKNGIHEDCFLESHLYTKEARDKIVNAVTTFLK
ncbi:MAG: hypothetical protein J6O51_07370 [Bacteroidales bacterium]|nr:hypothetical protein [Bacteroidales bacterium]